VGFATAMTRLLRGQGDDAEMSIEGGKARVRQTTWRLMEARGDQPPELFDAWNQLWVGAALCQDRFLTVEVTKRRDRGDECWEWVIG
ncbi:MAG: hypothetical protein WCI21_08480, partial [Alphaproteobacteria bacterium]